MTNRREWIKQSMVTALGISIAPLGFSKNASQLHFNGDPLGKYARLNYNENPYGPSPKAREAMSKSFDLGGRYAFQYYEPLVDQILDKERIKEDNLVLGAGSSEVLRMAAHAYGHGGGEILTCTPTYGALSFYGENIGAKTKNLPLTDSLDFDLDALKQSITPSTRLIYVCNPNNPTGKIISKDKVQAFCKAVPKDIVVIVDEAYFEYVDHENYASMKPLIGEQDNILIIRTFSKIFGLAGMRMGYGMGSPEVIEKLKKYSTRGSVNVLAVQAALASYTDEEYIEKSRISNKEAKSFLYDFLKSRNIKYYPSETNFAMFKIDREVGKFGELMKKQEVLVGRPFPPYTDWCRLSIGTMDEMKRFIIAFEKVN
ncbi:MAG: aminotransferase class I/II-fold pyridoxal phosphate-dependent enzyme [Bacteroidota bacterium]